MSEMHEFQMPRSESRVRPRSKDRPDAISLDRVSEYAAVTVSSETRDETIASREFGRWVAELGHSNPFIITSQHGRSLFEAIRAPAGLVTPPAGADAAWAEATAAQIVDSGAGAVLAIGGGRLLDIAKVAALNADRILVAAPTQLSHDGICSPVAIVPVAGGGVQSISANSPSAVFYSIPTLLRSPERSVLAGVGDLLSNPFALRDWEMAAMRGKDVIVESAWHLSIEAVQLIEPSLEAIAGGTARTPQFIGMLAHSLTNSGFSMRAAGSSRPASGAEHKISHTIDAKFGCRALHGEQVAFACIISGVLQGLDPEPTIKTLGGLGLPTHPQQLGLSRADMIEVLLAAPLTKPERFTVLENAALGRRSAGELIDDLWGSSF